nr:Rrf2 family transcriptional regulator [Sedimentibacter sp.]
MRISAKGRYALAATISIAQDYNKGEYITVISISEKLGISKIYLEQVFSLLKRGNIVNSIKGAQGGYQLAREPKDISVFEILSAVELSIFEDTENTVLEKAPEIEAAMRSNIFEALDSSIKNTIEKISLYDLVIASEKNREEQGFMFFI